MSISLQGYNNKVATFLSDTTDLVAGEPVMNSSDYSIKRATSNGSIFGVCAAVNGDYASIITQGVVEITYSSTAPAIGYTGICCDGSGGIKYDADSTQYKHIIAVDTTNKIATILL